MEVVERALKRKFVSGMIFSVLFVAGIPMIVFGAVNELWILMGVGICAAACGFYGTPLVWTSYGNERGLKRVVYAVEKEGLCSVQSIASHLSMNENAVRDSLSDCIRKGYLTGYVRKGDELEKNVAEPVRRAAVCPYCGAKFTFEGDLPVCPYCGAAQNREKSPK